MTITILPRVGEHGVPWCSTACPAHDGKRCEMIGNRPSTICEPAVRDLTAEVDAWRAPCERDLESVEKYTRAVEDAIARTDAWRNPR